MIQKKQIRYLGLMLLCTVAILLVTARAQNNSYSIQFFDALDTVSEITISTGKNGTEILEDCKDYVLHMDRLLSVTRADSEISVINHHAGDGTGIGVASETMEVLEKAAAYAKETNGFFDITVGSLVDLWEQTEARLQLPSGEELADAIHKVGYRNLTLDQTSQTVRLEQTGGKINLGGIAKGYITDGLVALLKEQGVSRGLINLGGNTYAIGKKSANKPWTIGIQDPDDPANLLGHVQVEDRCVITSGDYQRFFELDGIRYHHIMNPNTGAPAKSDLRAVTILSKDATLADVLSTTCFVLGHDASVNFLEQYEDVSAILVTDSHTVYYSKDLEDVFERTNSKYSYIRF